MVETRAQRITRAAQLLAEHDRLHAYVQRLETAFAAPPRPESEVEWTAELVVCLDAMRPLLRAHFAVEEEEDGLFDEIEIAWPAATAACERLRGEHAMLLAEFDRLAARIESGALDRKVMGSLLADGRTFCHNLAHHEERENEFLYRSLDDEAGPQD